MSAITLPPTFPVVGLGAAAICFLQFFQMGVVSSARKAAKVPYPNFYASDAEAKADQNKYVRGESIRGRGRWVDGSERDPALLGAWRPASEA